MKIGTVTGFVQAERRAPCLENQNFLTITVGQEQLVASDQVGAGVGNAVLLATGTTASRFCMDAPVDAAVVAILDSGSEV